MSKCEICGNEPSWLFCVHGASPSAGALIGRYRCENCVDRALGKGTKEKLLLKSASTDLRICPGCGSEQARFRFWARPIGTGGLHRWIRLCEDCTGKGVIESLWQSLAARYYNNVISVTPARANKRPSATKYAR